MVQTGWTNLVVVSLSNVKDTESCLAVIQLAWVVFSKNDNRMALHVTSELSLF